MAASANSLDVASHFFSYRRFRPLYRRLSPPIPPYSPCIFILMRWRGIFTPFYSKRLPNMPLDTAKVPKTRLDLCAQVQ